MREINIFHITSSDIKICDERIIFYLLIYALVMTYIIQMRYISTYTESTIYRNICLVRLIEIFYICFVSVLISLNCMNILYRAIYKTLRCLFKFVKK